MDKVKLLSVNNISKLPKSTGVYLFYERPFGAAQGKQILYIGKAVNILERVKNHFQQPTFRDNLFIEKINKIGFLGTGSEIEALILEANLIKKHQPRFNVIWRDDKNYFFVGATKEEFPKIFITHQTKALTTKYKIQNTPFVGPFVDGKPLKQTLNSLQKIFPWRACGKNQKKPCFWHQLDRCCGPCTLESETAKQIPFLRRQTGKSCKANAKSVLNILQGKKKIVFNNLKKEMKIASAANDFEKAAKIRDEINSLERVLTNAKIFEKQITPLEWEKTQKILQKIAGTQNKILKIEAYDISNIQGQEATGSMVTFIGGFPDKNLYRKFKIGISGKPNDVAMLKEVLTRRFRHSEWEFPDLILIDGGKAQLNAALSITQSLNRSRPKVLSIAKQHNELFLENKKEPLMLNSLPREIFNLILQLRDEAHRFAISYHKKLRQKSLLTNY